MRLVRWARTYIVIIMSLEANAAALLPTTVSAATVRFTSSLICSNPLFGFKHVPFLSGFLHAEYICTGLVGYCQPHSGGKAAAAAVECHQQDAATGCAEEPARSQTQAQKAW